ncbi:xanthine dehydrogenase accessory protein XdhC [Aeoliella sp. ICT_H6.2]|uniref:Xanthine dehydrogenase accessory protein XdhC n=1 Tax=Aeoliella straminimaris TaxID=2954799 RepID=A0A9X2JKE8_9BACT|nr:xanthine dehydrogenase accessory protein XdhC [Aeoliella straminimaris]MCO6046349.1 xanthine dehydrogenase accessory protein XdhC [Aeoliella straminimaris]
MTDRTPRTPGEVLQRCAQLVAAGERCVLVTLAEATGSTPADTGAKMLVTVDGLEAGTVGGGRVEAKAMEQAREMLATESAGCHWVDWNLKADVGMTCGGRVKMLFECFGGSAWDIVVFGAGHVAQALTQLLVTLPCQVTCVDSRSEWLAKLPPQVETVELAKPADYVDTLSSRTYVLCMTQGHRSDVPVLERLLAREGTFPFLGVIGSKAKAAVLKKDLLEAGIPSERIEFHCPVGLPIGTNHPSEIAVSIAAQLLEVRDAVTRESL